MLEITLDKEQEDAIIREHGDLAYAEVYIQAYANHLIERQKEADHYDKVATLIALPEVELDIIVSAVKAKEEEPIVEEGVVK